MNVPAAVLQPASPPSHPACDRRASRRLRLPLGVTVRPLDEHGEATTTHCVDLSDDGALLACIGLPRHVELLITLPGGHGRFALRGEVVREQAGRSGVRFASVPPRARAALSAVLAEAETAAHRRTSARR
ncbi:PilZ domain-containing protein [Conexibacter sp. SYSU D00693]|uniref:PilZ domain-containing protein n=1 Tax=Conexibacter sp. SYSU D00693 TaxID=2812560 RepID=UPI00196A403B|nr:PilZ domain-containing protein [Conexibacter sp. SYSU D00693]